MARVGRPFNTSTKLGKMMSQSGLGVQDVFYASEINTRFLCDYLAGRKKITNKHLVRLCAVFECEPEDLIEDEDV